MEIDSIYRIVHESQSVKVVSFDIFDTLVFRLVKNPCDVFSIMFDSDKALFPSYINRDDWKELRRSAERKIRQKNKYQFNHSEVTLEEIYAELPKELDKKELLKSEIAAELKVCFLNFEMAELLYKLHDEGYKCLLVSDMYLDSTILERILLKCNFRLECVEKIYVSCEHKASKRTGELYKRVLDRECIDASEIIHIGDNYYSDYGSPRKFGIKSAYYSLISEAKLRYPFLEIEDLLYGDTAIRFYSIRLLAASRKNDFWHNVGAMIYGPFMVLATEWILDTAEREKIQIIRPLMREGKFITELLVNAAKNRKKEFSIKPLYISRFAVFTAKFEQATVEDVKYLTNTNSITLREIVEILKVKDLFSEYDMYMDNTVPELASIVCGEESVWNVIYSKLTNEKTIKEIRSRNNGSSKKLATYLVENDLNKNAITVDVGWRGSIQAALKSVLEANNISSRMINLLYVSEPGAAENVLTGNDIRGFLGNYGSFKDDIWANFYRIFELFSMCDEGTTIGYCSKDGQMEPEKKIISYPEEQKKVFTSVQEGVISFQDEYFKMKQQIDALPTSEQMNVETHRIFERLSAFPLRMESEKIRKMKYDQNFGVNSFSDLIDEDIVRLFLQDEDYFYSHFKRTAAIWYSGLNVMKDGFFYHEMLLINKQRYLALALMKCVKKALEKGDENNCKIIIVCAGKNLFPVLSCISEVSAQERVEAIIDNDKCLEGISIFGIPVYGFNTKLKTDLFLCSTTNAGFEEAVFNQLLLQKGKNIRYISYYREYNLV